MDYSYLQVISLLTDSRDLWLSNHPPEGTAKITQLLKTVTKPLSGSDQLARLYYAKAEEALWGSVEMAKNIGREVASWPVLYSDLILHGSLVFGGKFENLERLIGDLIPTLREMALPNIQLQVRCLQRRV